MVREAAPDISARRIPLLINRNYALLWLGQNISVIGDQVFNTTLVVWIGAVLTFHLSYSALALSGVLIAAALPSLLFAPIAGVFVDRWDRRRTLIAADALRALLIAALLPVAGVISLPFLSVGHISLEAQLGAIYVVVFLTSACAQFFNPARLGLIGDIVAEPQQAQASGLAQASQSLAIILGPPLAAPLLFTFGVEWALVIDALSFVVSLLTILAVRSPVVLTRAQSGKKGNLWREMREGVGFVRHNRMLIAIVISLVFVVLGSGALNTLLIYFLTQYLHTPAAFYGFIGAAEGVGALGGALIAGLFAQKLGVGRVYSWSMIVAGALFVLLAQMTDAIPALVIIAVIGVFSAAANVALTPLVLHLVPRALLGRVFSLIQPFIVLGSLVGTALAGYLDGVVLQGFQIHVLGQTFRSVDTIYIAAGILVLIGGIYALLALRSIAASKNPERQHTTNDDAIPQGVA